MYYVQEHLLVPTMHMTAIGVSGIEKPEFVKVRNDWTQRKLPRLSA